MIPLKDDNPTKNKTHIRSLILILCSIVFFIQSSQIYKIKNLNFFFKRLSEVSEFSKSLIMEKEKTKANEIL